MMVAYVIVWWACGLASVLWLFGLKDVKFITWGELLFVIVLSFGGPAISVMIALTVLIRAEFWHKQVLWWKGMKE